MNKIASVLCFIIVFILSIANSYIVAVNTITYFPIPDLVLNLNRYILSSTKKLIYEKQIEIDNLKKKVGVMNHIHT